MERGFGAGGAARPPVRKVMNAHSPLSGDKRTSALRAFAIAGESLLHLVDPPHPPCVVEPEVQTVKHPFRHGFSKHNLEQCHRFYLAYREIAQTASAQSATPAQTGDATAWLAPLIGYFRLGWSHYVILLALKSEDARRFYEIEGHANSWGVRGYFSVDRRASNS